MATGVLGFREMIRISEKTVYFFKKFDNLITNKIIINLNSLAQPYKALKGFRRRYSTFTGLFSLRYTNITETV